MKEVIFTIGHSNHKIEGFIPLLKNHCITSVIDVRSQPYSRYYPYFSREILKDTLVSKGITYIYLGGSLGARSENPACYRDGKMQYDLLSLEPQFIAGLNQVTQIMNRYRIALMCAEKDPLNCHRAVLVARKLFEKGISIKHIHADSSLETHESMESRMLSLPKMPEVDMFRPREQALQKAYAIQGERIAYQDESMKEGREKVWP